jgi:hypothetical protein
MYTIKHELCVKSKILKALQIRILMPSSNTEVQGRGISSHSPVVERIAVLFPKHHLNNAAHFFGAIHFGNPGAWLH